MQMIWLRAFVKLAEQLNFSEAANEIFVSQSSLSKYIKLLEKYVDIPLIDRTTRKIRLTTAGEQFYSYAAGIVAQFDDMMDAMHLFREHAKQQLHIVQVSAVNIYGYAVLFSQFCKENPDIEFDIRELEMPTALRALKNSEVDFAVVRTNLIDNLPGYRELRLNTEDMMFLCNHQHRFAGREEISLDEVLQEKMVLQKFAVDEVSMLLQKYRTFEHELNVCVATTRASVVFDYVQIGLGVSVVSRSLFRRFGPERNLRLIPIKERPQLTLGILIRNGPLSLPGCRLLNYINGAKSFAGQYVPIHDLD